MNREEKSQVVEEVAQDLGKYSSFYVTDIGGLTVKQNNELRREAFKNGVKLRVVKNTLIRKALESTEVNLDDMRDVLKGSSAIMISEDSKAPARLIETFSKKFKKPLPVMKAAYLQESLFIGHGELENVLKLKSKNELIGGVLAMLLAPAANIVSALQNNAGQKIAALLKTLEERENA